MDSWNRFMKRATNSSSEIGVTEPSLSLDLEFGLQLCTSVNSAKSSIAKIDEEHTRHITKLVRERACSKRLLFSSPCVYTAAYGIQRLTAPRTYLGLHYGSASSMFTNFAFLCRSLYWSCILLRRSTRESWINIEIKKLFDTLCVKCDFTHTNAFFYCVFLCTVYWKTSLHTCALELTSLCTTIPTRMQFSAIVEMDRMNCTIS